MDQVEHKALNKTLPLLVIKELPQYSASRLQAWTILLTLATVMHQLSKLHGAQRAITQCPMEMSMPPSSKATLHTILWYVRVARHTHTSCCTEAARDLESVREVHSPAFVSVLTLFGCRYVPNRYRLLYASLCT